MEKKLSLKLIIQYLILLKKYKLSNKKIAIEHNGIIISKKNF